MNVSNGPNLSYCMNCILSFNAVSRIAKLILNTR